MAGKKGRSGKGRSKHGGWLFLRTGKMPDAKHHHIELRLNRLRQGLIDGLGGDKRVSEGQLLIIDQVVQFSGFLDLIHYYLKEGTSPFYIKDGQLAVQPALSSFYLACANAITRNIERLGLHKSAISKVPSLSEYIEVKARRVSEDSES